MFDFNYLRLCISSCVWQRVGESKSHTKYVMHFVIINESAAIFAICASMGVQQTEVNLINPENPWYGSQDRLVWFCNFFFVDRTQKIKLKWFQKWFLTPGTYSNCGKTIQDQDNMTDTHHHT